MSDMQRYELEFFGRGFDLCPNPKGEFVKYEDHKAEVDRLRAVVNSVIDCENERLQAMMSGLETGWEHPNTQTMFNKIVFMAKQSLTTDKQIKEKGGESCH